MVLMVLIGRFAIACAVGADLCVCPGSGLHVITGADTQVCPYTDLQTALERPVSTISTISGIPKNFPRKQHEATHIDSGG